MTKAKKKKQKEKRHSSSAFDTVDHNILKNHLENYVDIKDTALDWSLSCLSGRDSPHPQPNPSYAVPQRSGLRPMLFSIHMLS